MVRAKTILLVDDERAIRQVLRLELARHNYQVIEASGGQEALAAAQQHSGPIHLLLTDVAMPGLDGFDLAQRLRSDHLEISVVYMSGYASRDLVEYDLSEGTAYLQKPFDANTLVAVIDSMLESADRRRLELPESVAV